jgi:hypothetical protein
MLTPEQTNLTLVKMADLRRTFETVCPGDAVSVSTILSCLRWAMDDVDVLANLAAVMNAVRMSHIAGNVKGLEKAVEIRKESWSKTNAVGMPDLR